MAGSLRRIEDIEERTGRKSNMDKPLFFPNYKWFKRLKFTLSGWSVRVPDLRSFWLARFGLEPQFQKATSHRDLSLPIRAHTPEKTRPWGRKNNPSLHVQSSSKMVLPMQFEPQMANQKLHRSVTMINCIPS